MFKFDDLEKDISRLEHRKKDLETSARVIALSVQDNNIVESTLNRLERYSKFHLTPIRGLKKMTAQNTRYLTSSLYCKALLKHTVIPLKICE